MNRSHPLQAWTLAGATLLAAATHAWAEPAQSPLTARSAAPPLPNLMLTIDDSGSMLFDFIPEESFTINGKSVIIATSPSDVNQRFWPVGYPNDKRRSPYRQWTDGKWYTFSYIVGGVVTALGPSKGSVFEMQFRSPDINALYYNPDIWYRPWKNVDSLPNDMAKATYNNARLDPVFDSSSVLNLSKTISSKQNWCTGYKVCDADPTSRSFNPAIYYRLKNTSVDPNLKTSYTFYNLNTTNDSVEPYAPAVKHPNRKDCAGSRCMQDEEQQNFANWFTYYRLRETMSKAAISRSLVDYQDKIRVGWAQFNAANNSTTKTRVQQGIQPMTADQLKTVLSGIHQISSFEGTPTRFVLDDIGAYFQMDNENSPWLTRPGVAGSGLLTCRRSANFLLTDGYYNDAYTGTAGDADGTDGPDYGSFNPDKYAPTQYTAASPYKDGSSAYSNTLADVAMTYFKKDLQTSIDNRVPPVQGDIAFWQHLTQYTVGLGVVGTLDSTSANKAATLAKIKAGQLNWPDPAAGSAQKVDDLWHAAVNTGGDFYSAKSYEDLSKAMRDAIGKAISKTAKEAGVSLNSSTKVQGSYKFVPKYQAVSWYGDLEAYQLTDVGAEIGIPVWKASQPKTATGKPIDWAARNLLVWNPNVGKASAFTYASMGALNISAMKIDASVDVATLTDWVRGDTSNEAADKPYRTRSGNRYPDFVNSPPLYVKDLAKFDYSGIEAGYTSYLASKSNRSKGVVFLGGNGGMLHAFDSDTGDELMGFLPSVGLPKLAKIAAKDYGTESNFHQFVVDGPHIEADAYIKTRRDATAKWANVVVGTMGAGGRAIYALHVPTTNPTALDADTVLWQRSSADDTDFGYMMGDVAVGKIQSGTGGSASDGWKVFVGNGVDSTDGKAVLMVIDLSTGAVDKVVLDSTGGNGAMGVSLVKDELGAVVAAYVGDMKGQLWRVEFGSATDSATWTVGYGNKPLLQAVEVDGVTPQAITSAPLNMPFKFGNGQLVVFGTGRLLNELDADSSRQQTIYGVWDPTPAKSATDSLPSPYFGSGDIRGVLSKRTLGASKQITVGDVTYTVYPIEGEEMDWDVKKGWYLELTQTGQRVIYPVQPIFDDYIFVQSMVPAPKAAECEITSGSGMNFIFRAHEGLPPKDPIVDTNRDGKYDENDVNFGAYDVSADGTDGLVVPPDSECIDGFKIVWDFSTDPRGKAIRLACGATAPQVLDRVWREIVNPPQPK
ncbi:hypothetical protein KAK06_20555 [Ideonella sp. 4Y11]|uniref:PilY1 beta-propeller domain-containing protein n=1 Tax=Ideonella aquatica TaxID=2824119 RepID=A0A940YY98_9BURK|nr:PilC/PilY family type IV pilus protein [Ideonella aquatica]MBQ0961360.1 hypothetical protein [Ideonella aquatica]